MNTEPGIQYLKYYFYVSNLMSMCTDHLMHSIGTASLYLLIKSSLWHFLFTIPENI